MDLQIHVFIKWALDGGDLSFMHDPLYSEERVPCSLGGPHIQSGRFMENILYIDRESRVLDDRTGQTGK